MKNDENWCPFCGECYMYCSCPTNPLNTKKDDCKGDSVLESDPYWPVDLLEGININNTPQSEYKAMKDYATSLKAKLTPEEVESIRQEIMTELLAKVKNFSALCCKKGQRYIKWREKNCEYGPSIDGYSIAITLEQDRFGNHTIRNEGVALCPFCGVRFPNAERKADG